MSHHWNQDYFKVSGSPTSQRDRSKMAHNVFAQEQATSRRAKHRSTGPQSVPVHIAPPPKFKQKEDEPFARPPSVEASAPSTGGWSPPSFGEAARMAVGGVMRLGGWAAGVTLRAGRRAVGRRVEKLAEATIGRLRGKNEE